MSDFKAKMRQIWCPPVLLPQTMLRPQSPTGAPPLDPAGGLPRPPVPHPLYENPGSATAEGYPSSIIKLAPWHVRPSVVVGLLRWMEWEILIAVKLILGGRLYRLISSAAPVFTAGPGRGGWSALTPCLALPCRPLFYIIDDVWSDYWPLDGAVYNRCQRQY